MEINILKLLVNIIKPYSVTGLQHAGEGLREDIKKIRNPTQNPNFVLKNMWERAWRNVGNPRLTLGLHEHLHPSLVVLILRVCFYYTLYISILFYLAIVVGKSTRKDRLSIPICSGDAVEPPWQGNC